MSRDEDEEESEGAAQCRAGGGSGSTDVQGAGGDRVVFEEEWEWGPDMSGWLSKRGARKARGAGAACVPALHELFE